MNLIGIQPLVHKLLWRQDDDDEFGFNDTSTHGHLRQNCKVTWLIIERAVMVSHICMRI